MDKINGLSSIAEIFRSKATSKKIKTKNKASAENSKNTKQTSSSISLEELENIIKSKINQLDSSAQDFRSQASTIMIDNILSWEFGNDVYDDPEFISLRKKINNTLCDNQHLNKQLDDLIYTMIGR